jgi:hypothetical protein
MVLALNQETSSNDYLVIIHPAETVLGYLQGHVDGEGSPLIEHNVEKLNGISGLIVLKPSKHIHKLLLYSTSREICALLVHGSNGRPLVLLYTVLLTML